MWSGIYCIPSVMPCIFVEVYTINTLYSVSPVILLLSINKRLGFVKIELGNGEHSLPLSWYIFDRYQHHAL